MERRDSKIISKQQVLKSTFLLVNQSGDVWFQGQELLDVYEDAMGLFRKFFKGPKVLRNLDHLLIEQSGSGKDLNLVTFIGEKIDGKYDADLVFATKSFRKLNQRTPDSVFDLNFWYVEDIKLA